VLNQADAIKSVKQALSQASKAAGFEIKKAIVSIGGIGLSSVTSSGTVVITRADSEITELDVKKAMETSQQEIPVSLSQNRTILHTIPLSFKVDGRVILGKPEGLKGSKLEVKTLFITCFENHVNDLLETLGEASIEVEDLVAAPLAASLVTLSRQQKMAGVVLANIGSETVSIVVFENNLPISLEIFPIGSNDITNDIALGLRVPLEEAENIKKGVLTQKDVPQKKLDEIIATNKIICPKCHKSDWTKTRKFNQLVEVKLGTLEEGKNLAYLRGEIAQGIFLNFKNVLNTTRVRLPFGIAQQGKAFRAEITSGPFVHRTLEFDLMEFEYFLKEADWEKVYDTFRTEMWAWALELGVREDHLRWREHEEHERSFYSKRTMDIEYNYPFGWKEMFGIAYRTDYDLKNHTEKSGVDLSYLDPETNEKFTPHVVEPTFGLSRLVNIILFDSYREDDGRVYLALSPKIAPYKAAVFPLLANKPELVAGARGIYKTLKQQMVVAWDDRGNIGKRYLSQDEIGTPFCVTFDFQSLEDKMVTVRDRDTTKQERVAIDRLPEYLQNKLK